MSTREQGAGRQQLSRRDFIRGVAYLTGGTAAALALASCNPASFPVDAKSFPSLQPDETFGVAGLTEKLDYNQAASVVLRIDKAWQTLPERTFEVTDTTISDYLHDINGMFGYAGYKGANGVTPVEFEWMRDSLMHLRVLGHTNCEGEKIVLNKRFITPDSAWFNAIEAFSTATHEQAHNGQGREECSSWDNVEQTAQIVSWEMMAFAARGGNTLAAYALTREMRHVFLDIALFKGLKQKGGFQKFVELVKTISWSQFDESILHARMEVMPEQYMRLLGILEDYSEKPMSWVIGAELDGTRGIVDLAYPKQYNPSGYSSYSAGSDYEEPKPIPYSVNNLLEFIQNAQGYAEDIKQHGFIRTIDRDDWCVDNPLCTPAK